MHNSKSFSWVLGAGGLQVVILAAAVCSLTGCDDPAPGATLDAVATSDIPQLGDIDSPDGTPADAAVELDTQPEDVTLDDDGLTPDAIADVIEIDDVSVVDAAAPTDTVTADDTTVETAEPLVAPSETWTWIPIEGSLCGNGTPNGLAVNLTDRSTDVLIVLQGGGLCWDYNTCFVVKSASHVEDTLNSTLVLNEVGAQNPIFDRSDPENPFRNASFVFAPYCTGDFFAGDSVTPYTFLLDQRQVHHVGARNWAFVRPRLHATFPSPETVWLTGFSAGGLGVTWNWWRFLELYPDSEVHALNDCGTPMEPVGGRFAAWKAAVNFVPPPGCEDCLESQPLLLAHYAETVPAPNRYALLAYRQDFVLQAFTGLGWQAVQNRTDSLRNRMVALGLDRMKTYYIDGTEHVMMGRYAGIRTSAASGRVLAWDWVRAWALGLEGWDHAGP